MDRSGYQVLGGVDRVLRKAKRVDLDREKSQEATSEKGEIFTIFGVVACIITVPVIV